VVNETTIGKCPLAFPICGEVVGAQAPVGLLTDHTTMHFCVLSNVNNLPLNVSFPFSSVEYR